MDAVTGTDAAGAGEAHRLDLSYLKLAAMAAVALGPDHGETVVLDGWDSHDPWGSAMAAAFTVNDVLYLAGGETDDSYAPGAGGPAIDEDHGGPELVAALEAGRVQLGNVQRARELLSALLDTLKRDGRDY